MKTTTVKRIITDIKNECTSGAVTIEMENGRVFVADLESDMIEFDDTDPAVLRLMTDDGTKWLDAEKVVSIEI